jgi:hypothetical protein
MSTISKRHAAPANSNRFVHYTTSGIGSLRAHRTGTGIEAENALKSMVWRLKYPPIGAVIASDHQFLGNQFQAFNGLWYACQ